jgi:hypothetical protein
MSLEHGPTFTASNLAARPPELSQEPCLGLMSGVHRSGGARGITIQEEQQTLPIELFNTSGVLNTFLSLRVQVIAQFPICHASRRSALIVGESSNLKDFVSNARLKTVSS